MKKAVIIVASLLVGVLAALLFFGKSTNIDDPPPSVTFSCKALFARVPSSAQAAWVIRDFQAFSDAFVKSPISDIVNFGNIRSLLSRVPDLPIAGKFGKFDEHIRALIEGISTLTVFNRGRSWAICAVVTPKGELAFRDILSASCSISEDTLVLEHLGEAEVLKHDGIDGTPVFVFRFKDGELIVASDMGSIEELAKPHEDGGLQVNITNEAMLVGFARKLSGNSIIEWNLDKNGEKWTMDIESDLIAYISTPAAGKVVLGECYGATVMDAQALRTVMANPAIVSTILSSSIFPAIDADEENLIVDATMVFPDETDARLADLLLSHLGNGYVVAVLPKGANCKDFVLRIPVTDAPAFQKDIEEFAKAAGYVLKHSSTEPPVTYLAGKEDSIGGDLLRFRFWAFRDSIAYLSASQFSLLTNIRDDSSVKEIASGTVAVAYVDWMEIGKLLLPVTAMTNLIMSEGPDIQGMIARLGPSEISLQRTENGWALKGSGSLPIGLLLHILSADYN